jgi:hypothetical protein
MSEREKIGEGFLERWSRKKIESEREAPAPAPDERAEDVAEETEPTPAGLRQDAAEAAPPAPSPGGFDLSKLPSLESITASTDIRGFLAPGVPREIARAALRRAWAADPAIREFKGLAENDWDFTDPAAMPGFGSLPEGYDVKKMVAQVFGQRDAPAPEVVEPVSPSSSVQIVRQEPQEPEHPDQPAESAAVSDTASTPVQVAEAEIVQRESIAATHKSNPDDSSDQLKLPRQHGGALPK